MVTQRLTRRCCLPAALFLSLCFLSAIAVTAGSAPAAGAGGDHPACGVNPGSPCPR